MATGVAVSSEEIAIHVIASPYGVYSWLSGFRKVFSIDEVAVLIEANSEPKAPPPFPKRLLVGPKLAHFL
ncbi:hypothetical protein [Sulfitobacter sp. 1A15299]|uniref:hypothetical protein n=1 Tax=Sulfitobacter sp. 1A15299 TaxID=3368598 RepID=UPI00374A975A